MAPPRNREIKTFDQAIERLERASGKSARALRRHAFPADKIQEALKMSGGLKLMNTAKIQENARELRDHAVESLQEARDRMTQASRRAADQVDQEAHRNPWMFVGIAALFAAIFGFFLGRSSKR